MLSYELTRDEVKKMGTDIAILPIGSLEQHGPHLPINTDIITTEAYANEIGKELNAFQLPTLPISTCREHMGSIGSVWMNPDTFYRMVKDICMCLKEQGFKRIVILQGHGGIFMLTPILRELNATQNPDLMVCKVEPYAFLQQFKDAGIITSDVCLHADEFESSVVMHVRKDLVHEDLIEDYLPDVPREFLNYGSIFCASPCGVWGEPSKASAEKGKALLEMGSHLMVEYIHKVFDYMDNKKTVGYSSF